jgi:Fic family protein
MYIYQRKNWPDFEWDEAALAAKLAAVRHRQGRLLGRMEGLGFDLRNEAMLRTLTVMSSSPAKLKGKNSMPISSGPRLPAAWA